MVRKTNTQLKTNETIASSYARAPVETSLLPRKVHETFSGCKVISFSFLMNFKRGEGGENVSLCFCGICAILSTSPVSASWAALSWPFYPWDELDELLVLDMDAVFLFAPSSLCSLAGSSSKWDHPRAGWRNLCCSEMSRDETSDHSRKKGFIFSLCLL